MFLDLKGKIALVTGSTRGIGKAAAMLLGECGAFVFMNGTQKANLESALRESSEKGISAEGICGDITHESFAKEFIQRAMEKTGKIDILINNAGGTQYKKIEEMTEDSWSNEINLNLKGAFLVSKEVVPFMKIQKGGKIINIASTAGAAGREASVSYIAAKHGLIGFTKAMAQELGRYNIQVNAVSPGLTLTDLTVGLHPRIFSAESEKTPLGRVARPEDIAKVVLFLSSSLSDFITGQNIIVDGGRT